MTTWTDESAPSSTYVAESVPGSFIYLVKDDGTVLIKDDGTILVKDGTTASTLWWIDLTDNLQLEAVVDENGAPLAIGEIDVESGMQKILISENDNSTSWGDE